MLRRSQPPKPKPGSSPRRPTRARAHHDDRGSVALITGICMLIGLVVLLVATNFVVDQYGKGAVRTAVDEAAAAGSQQGAPGGPVAACQAKAAEIMSGLLSGSFARTVSITCSVNALTGQVVATGTGHFPGWLSVVPAMPLHVTGTAILSQNPTAP